MQPDMNSSANTNEAWGLELAHRLAHDAGERLCCAGRTLFLNRKGHGGRDGSVQRVHAGAVQCAQLSA
jgi:hypothetical protein